MRDKLSVSLDERVWDEILRYEPFTLGAGLKSATRAQLGAAAGVSQEKPFPQAFRIATFTAAQISELETWLLAVQDRSDAPVGARAALAAIREGIRLAH